MSIYNLWLTEVFGAGCINGNVIARMGYTPQQLYENRCNFKKMNIFTAPQIERAASVNIDQLQQKLEIHNEKGINSISYRQNEFPARFRGIARQPLVLYYKGDISLLSADCTVGVVGSRQCNGEGEKACEIISSDLAKRGAVVISGLAQGIDSVAHKTAIKENGKTVAFLGVPVDRYFPAANRNLQDMIMKDHLVVSEYATGQKYYSSNFIHRNRLIAAASDALCVIQAKTKSGSLATVNRSIEYERPVFTIPGSIFNDIYSGSNELLVKGKAMAVTSGNDILEYLGKEIPTQKSKTNTEDKLAQLSDYARTVYEIMENADFQSRIIKRSPLPAGITKAALARLEMEGLVSKASTGEYIKQK